MINGKQIRQFKQIELRSSKNSDSLNMISLSIESALDPILTYM
jgi:hypothetical protein